MLRNYFLQAHFKKYLLSLKNTTNITRNIVRKLNIKPIFSSVHKLKLIEGIDPELQQVVPVDVQSGQTKFKPPYVNKTLRPHKTTRAKPARKKLRALRYPKLTPSIVRQGCNQIVF